MPHASAIAEVSSADRIRYEPLPTIRLFHEDNTVFRCIVGEVGSGKSSAGALEIGIFLPMHFLAEYSIKKTRWVVVRNTYVELRDTTLRTFMEWFPDAFKGGDWSESKMQLKIRGEGYEAEILFRSCDRPQDIKKLKSLEITGFLIDESIEVPQAIKLMLENRIGRFPKKSPEKYGIEITNPPEVDHPTYSEYAWHLPPPGPLPPGKPLPLHRGFWQPPRENVKNLPAGYYEDLRLVYRDHADWINVYLDGKPGVMVIGKAVYNNFKTSYHVAKDPIPYLGGELIMGWDNSGNRPAAILAQIPAPMQVQLLREYFNDRMGIVDFTNYVVFMLNRDFPGVKDIRHWADPAGFQQYPKKEGGFTSNAELMADCGVSVQASEQNLQARIESVDQMLARIDGVLIDPSMTRLINGFLGGYCYPPNMSLQGEFLPNILQNKYAHPHSALQYLMVRVFKPDLRPDARDPVLNLPYRDHYNPVEGTGYDPFTWRPGGGR